MAMRRASLSTSSGKSAFLQVPRAAPQKRWCGASHSGAAAGGTTAGSGTAGGTAAGAAGTTAGGQRWWHNSKPYKLVRQYGAPLAIYYIALNESLVALLTYLLHYDYIGTNEMNAVIKWMGAEDYISLNHDVPTHSRSFGPFTISPRLVLNFSIATAFMSLWTGVQIPFCVATLPYLQAAFRGLRGWGRVASRGPV